MQYDAAKGDKNGDGGEHDGRDSPSLMAIGYFESDVAGLEFWVAVPENSGDLVHGRPRVRPWQWRRPQWQQVKAVACASEKPASFKFSTTVRVFVMQDGSLRI